MPDKPIRRMVEGAMIAALYVALTYFSRLLGLADGAVQFRLSELLTVLPALTPSAIPGLTVGCLIANLGSPFGVVDIVTGTAATFSAALCTRALRDVRLRGLPVLAPLPPVLFNGLAVGAVVALMNEVGKLAPSAFTFSAFAASALTAALGEAVVCGAGGYPLLLLLERNGLSRRWRWNE